nr:hypothetical protein [Bacillus sp. 2CMS4F]
MNGLTPDGIYGQNESKT